jgi:hypothetical protein
MGHFEDQYEVRNGIAYRKARYDGDPDALYAYCDRCGSRPIINNKCLKCDVGTPGITAERLARLMARCMHEIQCGSQFDGSGWSYSKFDTAEAAKIIEACTDANGIHVGQATNEDFASDPKTAYACEQCGTTDPENHTGGFAMHAM